MVKVKICGLMQPEDALIAARAGANFLGIAFVPGRRRRVTPQQARSIVDAVRAVSITPAPKIVGLFAEQPVDEVNRTIMQAGLDMVQLCGKESLDYCGQIKAGVIRVFHVPAGIDIESAAHDLSKSIEHYLKAGHTVALDRLVEGLQGGTGESFDWAIAARISGIGHKFILAGGLTPDNVAEAITSTRAWGVDVSSGVETNSAKDPVKIKSFISEARRASVAAGKKP